MQDDGGGERVWVPSITLGWDRGGFRPPRRSRLTTLSRVSGGGGDPQTLLLKWVPILDDSDVTDVMQVLPGPPYSETQTGKKHFSKTCFPKLGFQKSILQEQ